MDTLANQFISGDMIQALCRTLVHSLWQGIILAALAGMAVLMTRQKSAAFRYNLLTLHFVLFLVVTCGTFCLEWSATVQAPVIHINSAPIYTTVSGDQVVSLPEGNASILQQWDFQFWVVALDTFLNRYAHLIVVLWSLILAWRSVQMIGGIRYLHRVRRQKNRPANAFWQNQVRALSDRLQISKRIQLLESEIVTVPMVVGFLAPVILVPVGLLANLPPGQVEAILLHELAHIHRKDFLFNLLQCFVEIVFFFNPGVLWVSALIREERENCCDDMAVGVLDSKTHYVKALVAFQEFNLQSSTFTIAFPGRKHTLLDRVKRIVHHQHTKTLSIMEKISLVVSLLIVGAIALFPACQTFAQTPESTTISDFRAINIDGQGSTTDPQTVYVKDRKGKTYQYKKIDNKITEMYVDNQKVPEEKWADYNWLVREIDQQMEQDMAQAEADQKQAVLDMAQAQIEQEQAVIEQEQAVREQEQAVREQEQAVKEMAEDIQRAQQDAKEAAEMAAVDQQQAILDMQQAEIDQKQAMEDMARDKEQAERDMEQAKRDLEQAKRDVEQAKIDMKNAAEDQKMMKNLMKEIISDQLAKDKKSVNSFRLTDKEFEVNGVIQSPAVFQKYKAKYLKTKDQSIYYGQ